MNAMVTIGERKYVPKGKLVDTLFSCGGTADGEYAVRRSRGRAYFLLLRANGEVFAAVARAADTGGAMIVSAFRCERGIRYLYALTADGSRTLGEPRAYGERLEWAESVWNRLAAAAGIG